MTTPKPERTMNIAEFAQWVLENSSFAGCDLDGGEAQEKAVSCGILVPVKYDPATHGRGFDCDPSPGEDWHVYSDEFTSALKSPES